MSRSVLDVLEQHLQVAPGEAVQVRELDHAPLQLVAQVWVDVLDVVEELLTLLRVHEDEDPGGVRHPRPVDGIRGPHRAEAVADALDDIVDHLAGDVLELGHPNDGLSAVVFAHVAEDAGGVLGAHQRQGDGLGLRRLFAEERCHGLRRAAADELLEALVDATLQGLHDLVPAVFIEQRRQDAVDELWAGAGDGRVLAEVVDELSHHVHDHRGRDVLDARDGEADLSDLVVVHVLEEPTRDVVPEVHDHHGSSLRSREVGRHPEPPDWSATVQGERVPPSRSLAPGF